MKKQILNLGKILNKSEQKQIQGEGDYYNCRTSRDCGSRLACCHRGALRGICTNWCPNSF